DGLQRLVQRVPLGLELLGGGVLVRQLLLGLLDGVLGLGAVAVGDLLLVVLEQLLALVDELLEGVAGVGVLAALLVLGGVRLGVLHHAVDVLLGQGGAAGDLDGLLVAGAAVLGGHVDDAVGVDVEGDLDLRDAARRGGDAG